MSKTYTLKEIQPIAMDIITLLMNRTAKWKGVISAPRIAATVFDSSWWPTPMNQEQALALEAVKRSISVCLEGKQTPYNVVIMSDYWTLNINDSVSTSTLIVTDDQVIEEIEEALAKCHNELQEKLKRAPLVISGEAAVKNLHKFIHLGDNNDYTVYAVIEYPNGALRNTRVFALDTRDYGVESNHNRMCVIHDTRGYELIFQLGEPFKLIYPEHFSLRSFHALNTNGELLFSTNKDRDMVIYDLDMKKKYLGV